MTVSRDDLEAKLREIQGVVDETKESARSLVVVGAVAVVVVFALTYLIGRRRGSAGAIAKIEVRQVS
jgi:anti-sigma-K factor RskA